MTATTQFSEGVRRRLIGTLFLSQSAFGAAQIAVFTLLPIIAARLAGSDSLAGVPATMLLAGRAVGAYPAGWIMDRAGRRAGLSLGYLIAVAGSVLGVAAIAGESFLWLCAAAVLLGVGRTASDQGRFVAADIYSDDKRARAISLIVLAGTVGAIGGPLLVAPSSAWAERIGQAGQSGPFYISALLTFVALILTFGLLRPDPIAVAQTISSGPAGAEQTTSGRSLRAIFAVRRVQLAVAAMVIGQLVMTLIMVITPLHMSHQAHGVQAISFVIMAHTLGMFGLSWLTGPLIDRFGAVTIILVGSILLILSALMAPAVAGVPLLAAALFLLGLGWNFCFIAGSALLSAGVAPAERGRVQGAGEVLVALSSGSGSLGSGLAFAWGGMAAVSGIGLALSLAFAALVALLAQRRRAGQIGSV